MKLNKLLTQWNVFKTKASNVTSNKNNESISSKWSLVKIFVIYGHTKTSFYKQVQLTSFTYTHLVSHSLYQLVCPLQSFEIILLQTFLPSLEELIATHNQLVALEQDFHGLPVLCWADLSYNQIRTISKELVEKTQCQLHGVNRTLNIYLNGE